MLVKFMLVEFMDLHSLFVNREIRHAGIDPAAGIVVVDSVIFDLDGLVGMAAENAVGFVLACILQSSRGHFRRHAEPARVQAVNEPHDGLALEVELLQLEVERSPEFAEPYIVDLETVELMTVDRDMPQSVVLPRVVLVDPDSNQVRHDVGESVVVIAFYPHDFDVALGV
jgi:hypothetical protein